MAALPTDELQRRIQAGALYDIYATTVDRQSAHEIITARLQAAQAAVAAMQPVPVGAATAGSATPAGPTPAQERAEIERRARELERIRQSAEREARAQAKEEAAAQRAAERARLQRERELSQVGNTVLRGVLGTLFGGSKRRR
jgi:vacuolar-type H+-ATPase subunit I/STV1